MGGLRKNVRRAYARVRRVAGREMPAISWTRRVKATAAAGVRKAMKIVSSPPMVPRASSIGVESIALASGWAAADRKSTRLNSSHGYISYAVFCLKKKNKKNKRKEQ